MSAFASGAASSFSDLLTALTTFCTAQGFTVVNGATAGDKIIHKGSLIARFRPAARYLYAVPGTGVSGNTVTGELVNGSTPTGPMIADPERVRITWPINYDFYFFDNPDELYIVVNYNGGMYQNMQFGMSDVAGLGGTGMWCSGSWNSNSNHLDWTYGRLHADAYQGFSVSTYAGLSGGMFSANGNGGGSADFIHNALEGVTGWSGKTETHTAAGGLYSPAYIYGSVINSIPSQLNEVQALLPILLVLTRGNYVGSIAAVLRNARSTRIDNVTPGQVIAYGSESWKFYPYYAKNMTQRDGVNWATGADHSGTHGFAIRYIGP